MTTDQQPRSHNLHRPGRGRLLLLLLALTLLGGWLQASQAAVPESAQKPIIEKALEFVQLLDRQRPQQAWAQTARYFRSRISLQRWQQIYEEQRLRFGSPQARQIDGYKFFSTYEKALDGLYLEVRFRTDFIGRDAIERVIMYKDYDGRWRPIGYYLEPD